MESGEWSGWLAPSFFLPFHNFVTRRRWAISRMAAGGVACSGAFVFATAAAAAEADLDAAEAQMALNVANTPSERDTVHISMTERKT